MSGEEEKPPQFVREPDHVYTKGEKIYVIDVNGFDIYAAEIKDITETSWSVHYPDYPEDDFTANDTKRFLTINEENKKIFEDQESVRKCKELEEEDEEAENGEESGEPDDPEDGDAQIGEDDE